MNPWDADAPFDADVARAEIEKRFFAPERVEYFAEGWDFYACLVDDTWVFRFPKRAHEVERLRREVPLLEHIRDRLPVEVPYYEFYDGDVGGYRFIEGESLDKVPPPVGLGTVFGEFLSILHATEFAGLPDGEWTFEQLNTHLQERFAKHGDRLAANLRDAVRAHLALPTPAQFRGKHVVMHGDIFPEHVLATPHGIAVIDWSDALLSDPAGDFVILHMLGREPLVEEALRTYTLPVDDGFMERVRYSAGTMAVGHLLDGAGRQQQRYIHAGVTALQLLGYLA